ncbi:MAG: hypothetical protein JO270_25175 [Acidobacteriaceae bacterium]|nr:hypothetical protein [Acidobacteriaceae bacterium]
MHRRVHPLLSLLLLAAVVLALAFGIHRWREPAMITDAQLVALLPAGDRTVFFIDFASLRRSGLLKFFAGVQPGEDRDYQQFVKDTEFDYARDADVLAGSADGREVLFIARGRFDWNSLKRYAKAHGGACSSERCQAPASTPGRWACFRRLTPDVLVLAVGENREALTKFRWVLSGSPETPASAPVWVRVAPAVFRNPAALPAPLRLFDAAVQQAESVVISLRAAETGSTAAFNIQLDATFPSAADAQAAGKQLQLNTNMLKLAALRDQGRPETGDLTGLLTAGTFESSQTHVYGKWPVSQQVLRALE